MARPIKEGADYFTHDTDASSDEKIEAMRALYGNDGYAFYFILLERIYKTDNGGFDISKPAIYAMLIKKVGVTKEKFEEMMKTAFEIELFSRKLFEEEGIISSNGIQKRYGVIKELRENWKKKKEKYKKKIVFSGENPIDNSGENEGKTGGKTSQSKEKESKEKESKEKESKEKESKEKESKEKNIYTPIPPVQQVEPCENKKPEISSEKVKEYQENINKWTEENLNPFVDIEENSKKCISPKNKKENELKKAQLIAEFEEDWLPYPNKEFKQEAIAGYMKARKQHSREKIQQARDNYILVLQNESFDRKPMNGGRFFKKEYINYFEVPEKLKIQKKLPSEVDYYKNVMDELFPDDKISDDKVINSTCREVS